MIELRTLGPLDVVAPDPRAVDMLLRQPKRCAVFVFLAASAPGGFVRRDSLLALFWPEVDQQRGRNALRQTLYTLRQFLGAEAIRSRGDEEIGVSPEFVTCDANRLQTLLQEGKIDDALELYRGDFLTGFHVADAAVELEEWMQSERMRLRSIVTSAAWALARAEEDRRNSSAAAHWARRVMSLDPLNEQRLVDAMKLLARVGDRTSALRAYDQYARRAESELGMTPAAGVERLIDELRSTSLPVATEAVTYETPSSAPDVVVAPRPSVPETRSPFWTRRARAAAVGVFALASFAILVWSRPRATPASTVAHRLYDRGLRAYYELDRTAAYRLFHAALAEDSTFAMAAYYAGFSTTDVRERESLLQRAARLSIRATDRERLVIAEGIAASSMSAKAVALADTMVVRYPRDPDAQLAFGHVLLRRGDFDAAARQFRRVIAMDSAASHEDGRCLSCDAHSYLTWAYLFGDSVRAAARVTREFSHEHPTIDSFSALEMTLGRTGEFAEARRALQTMDSLSHGSTAVQFASAVLSLREGAFAGADARLRQLAREGDESVREEAEWDLMISLRMQGRLRETLDIANRHRDPLTRAIALFENGRAAEAAKGFQSLVNVTDTILTGNAAKHRAWMLTHVATSLAAAGDTARLTQLADSVQWIGQLSMFGRDLRLHHYIRGLLWNARGERQRAAESFRQSIWSWSEGYTRENSELARALLALDRPVDAVYPLQAALRGDLQASNLYVTRTELHELLAQAFDRSGNRDSAVVHYRAVANAWQRCDSDLRPRLIAARARLNELSVDRRAVAGGGTQH